MISVVICTYNRPKKVNELVQLISFQTALPEEVIVVDSSDEENPFLKSQDEIRYIRTSHKNQPYQRYLGYLASQNEWLLYLDDDMEPVNEMVITDLNKLIKTTPYADAFAIRFENVHEDTFLSAMPKSKIIKGVSSCSRCIHWFTGYPILPVGFVGWNGVRGVQPHGGFTEWFSGGAFMARKKVIFRNFNFGLFSMFENKIGMGEDLIIAYSISQLGKIWSTEKIYFFHNDQKDSTYTFDIKSFNRRVIYSRLYFSLEKARLTKRSRFIAIIYYLYFAVWRGLGLLTNLILNPSKNRILATKGFISGFINSPDLIRINRMQEEHYWILEAQNDLNLNKR